MIHESVICLHCISCVHVMNAYPLILHAKTQECWACWTGGWFRSGFVFESWASQGLPTWSPPFRIKSRPSAAVLLIDDTWSCNHPFSLNYTHCLGNPILGRDFEHTTHMERTFRRPNVGSLVLQGYFNYWSMAHLFPCLHLDDLG